LPFLAIDSTAITAIIFAAAVVVVVITVAIADIVGIATLAFTVLGDGSCCRDGSFGGLLGIQAFATGLLVAVRVLVFIARFTAAVSAIPFATTIVVVIITAPISDPIGRTALARALVHSGGFGREAWVEALATFLFVAVRVLVLIAGCATTVTSIPVASAVIVVIVTAFVPLEVGRSAFAVAVWIDGCRGRRGSLCGAFRRIATFTFFAVTVLMLLPISSTAIAIIPVTAAVVVLVVAVTVLGESFQATFAFAVLMGSHGSCRGNKVLLCRVEALTFFAVTVLVFVPTLATTVTAVPSATAIVVLVVAVAIFEVKLCSARFRSRTFRFRGGLDRLFGGLGRGGHGLLGGLGRGGHGLLGGLGRGGHRLLGGLGRGGCSARIAADIFELERFRDKLFEVSSTGKAIFSNESQCCFAGLHSSLCFVEVV